MQYTTIAIATVAGEAVGRCAVSVGPWDLERVVRIGGCIVQDIVIAGHACHARDASSWDYVFLQIEKRLDSWGLDRGLYKSIVEYVGRAVLDSCRSFVGLERRCGRGEE